MARKFNFDCPNRKNLNRSEDMVAAASFTVERFTVESDNSFDQTLKKLRASVGHPNLQTFLGEIESAKSEQELEEIVKREVSSLGLMEFVTFDLGEVLKKELGDKAPRSLRLLIGNPVIMKQLVKHVPDAGSYAPVTILLHEHDGKVLISYDTMTSYLEHYGDCDALSVASDLDAKIQALLKTAAC
jgi:uncharacterized protein (DUF302 family)